MDFLILKRGDYMEMNYKDYMDTKVMIEELRKLSKNNEDYMNDIFNWSLLADRLEDLNEYKYRGFV